MNDEYFGNIEERNENVWFDFVWVFWLDMFIEKNKIKGKIFVS